MAAKSGLQIGMEMGLWRKDMEKGVRFACMVGRSYSFLYYLPSLALFEMAAIRYSQPLSPPRSIHSCQPNLMSSVPLAQNRNPTVRILKRLPMSPCHRYHLFRSFVPSSSPLFRPSSLPSSVYLYGESRRYSIWCAVLRLWLGNRGRERSLGPEE